MQGAAQVVVVHKVAAAGAENDGHWPCLTGGGGGGGGGGGSGGRRGEQRVREGIGGGLVRIRGQVRACETVLECFLQAAVA